MVSRAERVKTVTELMEMGLSATEIGDLLGVNTNTVRGYISDPDGSKDRRRKASYGRPCAGGCGRTTTGCDGRVKAPTYCRDCTYKNPLRRSLKRWTRYSIIAAIWRWHSETGEIPSSKDWWYAENGYPQFMAVVREFGTWNKGIRAAGFEPRKSGGSQRNYAKGLKKRKAREQART